jgi:hypothetical protein
MRTLQILPLALMLAGGAAMAQTGAQTGGQTGSQTGAKPGSTPSTTQSAPQNGNPALKNPSTARDAPASTGVGTGMSGQGTFVPMTSLERGSNSFTEGQARSRLESAGLSNVGALSQGEDGIWRGTAQMGGRQVNVGLDYRGSFATQ